MSYSFERDHLVVEMPCSCDSISDVCADKQFCHGVCSLKQCRKANLGETWMHLH